MNRTSFLTAVLALTAGLAYSSVQAAPSLIGDTVDCGIVPTPFWICTTPTAVVGPGNEFQLTIPASTNFGFDVDLGASSVRIASNRATPFGLGAGETLTLSDLDFAPSAIIVGIANFTSSLVTGMTLSDVTFADHSVTIDLDNNTGWQPGSFVSFDLIVAQVPEPNALLLLSLGLVYLGCTRRPNRVQRCG